MSSASQEAGPERVRDRRKRTGRAPGEPRRIAYLYLLPALAVYGVFTLVPMGQTIFYSLFEWDGITPRVWRGLGNYRELVDDPTITDAFKHSLELILFYSIFSIALGLFLTAILTRFRVRGFTFFRTVLFMPQTVATVVVAQAFTWIYDPSGPLNKVIRGIGLDGYAHGWIGNFDWALRAVGLTGTWITFGLCMVLFLAGAQKIPDSLYDAAKVDGAGFVREFFAVTLPGLRNELVVALTLTTITALRSFDLVYNMTGGGPGGETTVPSWLMYNAAFGLHRVGYAAAIATVLTAVIALVAIAIGRLSRRAA